MSRLSHEDVDKIRGWSRQMRRPRVDRTIHSLVKEKTLEQPQAQAICAHDGDLTYRQLDNVSGRLAAHLVGLVTHHEFNVALCMNKSKFAVVAMLAILQAGAVVVPIGVHDPPERVQNILRNTGARVVIVDQQQAQRLEQVLPQHILVDEVLLDSLVGDATHLSKAVRGSNAAWIVHTSGSTGVPKGVVLEHGGIATLALAQAEELNAGKETRRLQFASFTFDVSIADMFTTLCSGGCICIPSEEDRLAGLERFICTASVNFASITSTVAGLLDPSKVPSLKSILLGGEAAARTTIRRWLGHVVLRIGYGPAECTVSSSHSPPVDNESQGLDLGFPLTGVFWVASLEDHNRLCPLGDEGELLIESPTVARGYFGDPDKTAKAFVTDPAFIADIGLSTGHRMYRTGDVVRQNSNGSITFVSRNDRQIKIRGQRVETGEIEHQVLHFMPNVTALSVLLLKRGTGGEQSTLVAALDMSTQGVTSSKSPPFQPMETSRSLDNSFHRLRTSLLKVLPSYMVPSIYVPMNRLPVNASGKLDEKTLTTTLLAMKAEQLNLYSVLRSDGDVRLGSKSKVILQAIWSSLLAVGQDEIGLDDDFFRLGGDGDLARELAASATAQGLRLTVADVFKRSTFVDMAYAAEQPGSSPSTLDQYEAHGMELSSTLRQLAGECLSPVINASKSHIIDVLPATNLQARFVAGNLSAPRMHYHYLCLNSDNSTDFDQLKSSLLRLVDEVESLRVAFTFNHKQMLQLVLSSYDPGIQIYRSHSLDETTIDLVAHDMFRPPQLRRPLVDIAIIQQISTGRNRSLMRISKAIADEASCDMIWQVYKAIHEGSQIPRRPPFSRTVVDLYREMSVQEDHKFWRDYLHEAPETRIYHHNIYTTFKTRMLEPSKVVLGRGHLNGIAIGTLVKTAWAIVLAGTTGRNDIVFAQMLSMRDMVPGDITDTIGCCSVQLPLRVIIEPEWTNIDLIHHIQDLEADTSSHAPTAMFEAPEEFAILTKISRISSLVVHHEQRMQQDSTHLNDSMHTVSEHHPDDRHGDFEVCVTSKEKGGLISIDVEYAVDGVPHELAQDLQNSICAVLGRLINSPESTISAQLDQLSTQQAAHYSHTNNGNGIHANDATLVQQALAALRANNGAGSSNDLSLINEHHDRCIDLVEAAQISDKMRRQGHDFSVEHVLQLAGNNAPKTNGLSNGVH